MASFFNFRTQGKPKARATSSVSGNATRAKRRMSRPRTSTKRKRTFKGRSTRKGKGTTKLTKLNRRVAKIARGLAGNTGTLTHRQLHVNTYDIPQYISQFHQQIINSASRIEGTLTAVPMYDSSSTTVVSNNFTTGTTQLAFNFARTRVSTTITNNSLSGIVITAGYMAPNEDTSFGPSAAWAAGLVDGALTLSDPLLRLSDSQVLKDLWHFVPGSQKNITLSPGGRLMLSTAVGGFTYQRATQDADALSYRKDNKPLVLIIHAHGALQNDTAASTQLNYSAARIHVESLVTRTITYAAGADIRRTVTVSTERTEFTNAGEQVNQPEAVLQSFV